MTDTILTHGLKRKYAELAGQLREAHKTVHALKEDMASVKATMKLFGAEGELDGIKPRAPSSAGKWFVHGQCSRTVLDTLRTAQEPLTAREIADKVTAVTGIGPVPPGEMVRLRQTVKLALISRRDLLTVTADRPARWALAD